MRFLIFFLAGLAFGLASHYCHAEEPVVIPQETVDRCVAAGGCVLATKEQLNQLIVQAYAKGIEDSKVACLKGAKWKS